MSGRDLYRSDRDDCAFECTQTMDDGLVDVIARSHIVRYSVGTDIFHNATEYCYLQKTGWTD